MDNCNPPASSDQFVEERKWFAYQTPAGLPDIAFETSPAGLVLLRFCASEEESAAGDGRRVSPQAVGHAVATNPILILVPCHRVLGAGGISRGYAAGKEVQKILLALEAKSTNHVGGGGENLAAGNEDDTMKGKFYQNAGAFHDTHPST